MENLADLSNSKLAYRLDALRFEAGYIEAKTEFDRGSYVLDHPATIEGMRRWDQMSREYKREHEMYNPYLAGVADSLSIRLFQFLQST